MVFRYPAFGQASPAAVPDYSWAAAIQGSLKQQAALEKRKQITEALRGAGSIYGGVSDVMNPEGTKPEDFREPLTTGFKAAKNKLGGMFAPARASSQANPALQSMATNPALNVRGGGGLGTVPPAQPALAKQAAAAQALRAPAQTAPVAASSAAPASQAGNAASTASKVAGGVGQGLGYLGAGLQGADAIAKYRAGDTKGAGKSGAGALGTTLLTAGLANAYNPLGWALMTGGAASSLYGMLG